MVIRKADIRDIAAINELFYELDTHEINLQPEHIQRGERPADYLSEIINGERSDFLLAVADGEIVGFSSIFARETSNISILVPCKYAYIQDLVVKEGFRNKSIGTVLMDESKKWAKQRGMDYLRLSVLPKNNDAQRFYRRNGLCEQMITMECPLK